jgi:hypothetical protein
MGNYQLSPPKEFSFPKIRNPEMSGVACKHVLRSATMLQSVAWQRIIAAQMKAQAKRIGYGSDNRTHTLTKAEQKEASKNRKVKTSQSAADKAHRNYVKATKAMEKAVSKTLRDNSTTKRQARKIRKQSNQIKELNDMLKMGFSNFHDGYKLQGKTKADAVRDFAKMMNVTESKLKRIVK